MIGSNVFNFFSLFSSLLTKIFVITFLIFYCNCQCYCRFCLYCFSFFFSSFIFFYSLLFYLSIDSFLFFFFLVLHIFHFFILHIDIQLFYYEMVGKKREPDRLSVTDPKYNFIILIFYCEKHAFKCVYYILYI